MLHRTATHNLSKQRGKEARDKGRSLEAWHLKHSRQSGSAPSLSHTLSHCLPLSLPPSIYKISHEHFSVDCIVWVTVWSRTPCKAHTRINFSSLCEHSVRTLCANREKQTASRWHWRSPEHLAARFKGNPFSNSKKKRQNYQSQNKALNGLLHM